MGKHLVEPFVYFMVHWRGGKRLQPFFKPQSHNSVVTKKNGVAVAVGERGKNT